MTLLRWMLVDRRPVLDGIGNPHNLGAIARSAAFFGCRSLLLTDDPRQADISDAVRGVVNAAGTARLAGGDRGQR